MSELNIRIWALKGETSGKLTYAADLGFLDGYLTSRGWECVDTIEWEGLLAGDELALKARLGITDD